MSNLNWCTYCDSAINHMSDSLYCSESCLRSDALNHHPLLGYDYAEFKDFPRSSSPNHNESLTDSPPLSPFFLNPSQKKPTFDLNNDSTITTTTTTSSSSASSSFESLSSFYQSFNNSSKTKQKKLII